MVACPACHAEADNEAKFCSRCGTSLDVSRGGRLSDFEIGKIAALDSLKKDVLKWVGGSAGIIGAAFAILAYLGLNATLQSSITEQVKEALRQNQKDISGAIRDIYISAGKINNDEERITKQLSKTSELLATLEQNKVTLEQDVENYRTKINELESVMSDSISHIQTQVQTNFNEWSAEINRKIDKELSAIRDKLLTQAPPGTIVDIQPSKDTPLNND